MSEKRNGYQIVGYFIFGLYASGMVSIIAAIVFMFAGSIYAMLGTPLCLITATITFLSGLFAIKRLTDNKQLSKRPVPINN